MPRIAPAEMKTLHLYGYSIRVLDSIQMPQQQTNHYNFASYRPYNTLAKSGDALKIYTGERRLLTVEDGLTVSQRREEAKPRI